MSMHAASSDKQVHLWGSSPAIEHILFNGGGCNPQSQGIVDVDGEHGSVTQSQEKGNTKWIHQRKLFLIQLLKDHDVPGFRTQNAWSKEAWNNIACRLNEKFGTSYTLGQVKQKEQDLKKDYRSVKDLVEQSGFGWNSERMMVEAPENIWPSFTARKNNEAALHWRDKSFPYYDDLSKLYDGHYVGGRARQGMDHYASKTKNASVPSRQASPAAKTYRSSSPTLNLGFSHHPSTHSHQMEVTRSSTQTPSEVPDSRHGKKQKSKSASPPDGFHERYLKLKKEEIDRFVSIEEKKLEDPYSINKCIAALEDLDSLQVGHLWMASDIFKIKDNREVFLSFKSDGLRLAWITRETGKQAEHQN